jgi:hypothetical protein
MGVHIRELKVLHMTDLRFKFVKFLNDRSSKINHSAIILLLSTKELISASSFQRKRELEEY